MQPKAPLNSFFTKTPSGGNSRPPISSFFKNPPTNVIAGAVSSKPALPTLTKNSSTFAGDLNTATKDVAVGAAKDLVQGGRAVADLFQQGGKKVLGAFGVDTSKMGIKSIDNSTPEGAAVNEELQPKSAAEKTGSVIGEAGQIASGFEGGAAEDLLAKGKSVITKIGSLFKPSEEKELGKLVEETSGVADKKGRIASLEKTGATNSEGKPVGGSKQTLFGGVKTEPTPQDLERAKSVQGIVKPGASPVINLTNLNKEISNISENQIAPALEKAGSINPISKEAPGWSKITQRLTDIEKPDIIKADPTLDKTYDLVRQRMIDQIQKQPPTVKGLWDARKSFDKVVEDQFGDAAFNSEKNTAIKRAISDMRREVNNIIGDRVPEYKPLLNKLSNMYDARYNIAESFQNILDKGGWKSFQTLNPKSAAALKWGITGGGLTIGGKVLKNIFSPDK